MGFFGFIFLCLLIWFVVRVAIGARHIYKRQKAWQEQFNSFFGGGGTPNGSRTRSRSSSKPPKPPKRKIFGKEEGEYVEFEELEGEFTETRRTPDGEETRRTRVSESRVTDAEWEDL